MKKYLVDHLCKNIECMILLWWVPVLPFINSTWVDWKRKLFAFFFCFDLLRCQYYNILPINVHPPTNLPKFKPNFISKDPCWVGMEHAFRIGLGIKWVFCKNKQPNDIQGDMCLLSSHFSENHLLKTIL